MHICMVTNNYTPYQGGVVSSINATVQALQLEGHKVTLITLDFPGRDHHDPSWVKRLQCPIKFIYKKNPMAIAWRPKKQLRELIIELAPDIVHVHHPFLLGYIAASVAQSQAIPTVFTYHTVYEAYVHYLFLPETFAKRLIRRKVLSFCKSVSGIIAPSSFVSDYLLEQNVTAPIRTIPSGLQKIFFSKLTEGNRKNPAVLQLISVGRMVKEKNVEALIRIAAGLVRYNVPFRLSLVGYGQEYEALKTYAYHTLNLSKNRIIFIHRPPKEMLVRLYQESDLFLFSSRTDTQGIVLAEAMASGLPVLALDGPGQRDIIQQGKNGYIVSDEIEATERIKAFASNRIDLERMSRHARETAETYHPDLLVKRLVDFYRSLR